MDNIPQEQLNKRFQLLPESLQDAIFSEKTANAIIKTCVLREAEEHTSLVAALTGHILLGYLRPELFALEIQKETGMDIQKARLIAQDLDAEIFSAVRLELKKLYPPTIQTPTVQTWKAESRQAPAPSASSGQAKPRYVIPIPEKFLRQSTDIAKSNMARSIDQYGETRSPATESINHPEVQRQQIISQTNESQRAETKSPAEARPQARPDLQQPINQPTPIADSKTNSVDDNLKSAGGGQVSEKPQENLQATTYKLQPNSQPAFKPVVPLPTFIQTQFKTTQVDSQKSAGNVASPGLQQRESLTTPDQAQRQISQQQTKTQQAEAGTQESSLANDPRIKSLISKFTSSSTQKPKPPAESPYRERV